MKKLLKYLTDSLVQYPKDLKIEEIKEENQVLFNIKANPEDLKILIGKGGQTIKSLRELLRLKSFNQGVRVDIKIEDRV